MIGPSIHCVRGVLCLALMFAVPPALAQETHGGHVASSATGVAGTRQERDQSVAGIDPTARLNSRIRNRVQSRIRNRIDRYYDPQANAVAPFGDAADRAESRKKP